MKENVSFKMIFSHMLRSKIEKEKHILYRLFTVGGSGEIRQ